MVPLRLRSFESTARGRLARVSLGFVHACEQNHLGLSVIGGGGVVQLAAGKVVTCPVDPLFIYNYAFGIRLAYDAAQRYEYEREVEELALVRRKAILQRTPVPEGIRVPTSAETSAFRTAFLSRLLDQLRS